MNGALSIVLVLILVCPGLAAEFSYPFYSFRRKSSWARKFNAKEYECRSTTCKLAGFSDLDLSLDEIVCVRKCLSPKCYDELYSWNELEEGEVDVRGSSFKGCVTYEIKGNATLD